MSGYKDAQSERDVIESELNWINKHIIGKTYPIFFSKTNDFQFSKGFLEEHPELKDLKRSRIIL